MAAGADGARRGRARSAELFWGQREPPSRGPKPGLSTERIVRTAVEVADAEGLRAVSMQRIAGEFGFTTMSLYRYLPGKAELIELMIDSAVQQPPELAQLESWRPRLELWARCFCDVYHSHPWMFELAVARPGPMGPNQLNWLETAVAALSGTALTGAEKLDAVFTITGLVRVWTFRSADREQASTGTDLAEQRGAMVGDLIQEHRDRYPALMAAMSAGALDAAETDGEEFGLRCVLDGLGSLMAQRGQQASV